MSTWMRNSRAHARVAALALAAAVAASLAATAQTGRQPRRGRDAEPGYEFTARRGDEETKIRMYFRGGASGGIWKVTATDAAGTRTLKAVKPGGRLAQPCDATQRTCETIRLEGGRSYKVCSCKSETAVALLLPAVQSIREAAGGGGGGGGGGDGGGPLCSAQKPCCYEDEKLQMSICHPSL